MLTYHQSRIALGSVTDLVIVSTASEKKVNEHFRRLWLQIFEFENRCSRFLIHSELSRFNRAAGTTQPISPEFHAVLAAAIKMAARCDGLYNPFILPALQRAGYVHSMVAAHSHDEVDDYSQRSVVPADHLEIGDTWARIPYGTAIDIGGCGKGYAGDKLADLADTFTGMSGYWFSLGGDIVTGGLDEYGKPWIVNIENTTSSSVASAGTVLVPGAERYAVATSSITQRKGTTNGNAWHHIIDPRTNRPAVTTITTATVCARSALIADVVASCVLLLDIDHAQHFAQEQGADGFLLQTKTGNLRKWRNVQVAGDSPPLGVSEKQAGV